MALIIRCVHEDTATSAYQSPTYFPAMSKAFQKRFAKMEEEHANHIYEDSQKRYKTDILIASKLVCNILGNTLT